MTTFKQSTLALGALALTGLLTVSAPAFADDYDNHGNVSSGAAIQTSPNQVLVQVPLAGNYDDNHGVNSVVKLSAPAQAKVGEQIADASARRARIAAADEAKRLQQ